MATGTRLELEFADNNNNSIFFTINYAKSNATTENVKALINAIINNGDIFALVPVTAKSAKIITTTENDYNIS